MALRERKDIIRNIKSAPLALILKGLGYDLAIYTFLRLQSGKVKKDTRPKHHKWTWYSPRKEELRCRKKSANTTARGKQNRTVITHLSRVW